MNNSLSDNSKISMHIHSDCYFFAGCENMVANFLNSDNFQFFFDLSFSFRFSKEYKFGLLSRVPNPRKIFPLVLRDFDQLRFSPSWPTYLAKIVGRILMYPLFVYEVIIFYRLFKKNKPTILHINNGGYPGALSCRAAAIAGRLALIPFITMVVNNLAVGHLSTGRRYEYLIDFFVSKSVNYFITASAAAGNQLQNVLKLDSDSIVNIHNGIDRRKLTESASQTRDRLGLKNYPGITIGIVAVMESRKGHRVLFQAMQILIKRQSNLSIKLLVEGSGILLDELKKYVIDNKLEGIVIFVGDEPNIMNFLNMLDVLILPSTRDEDFPNIILEAMSLAKPVIATKLAGIPEQVTNGETGILVEVGSPDELCDAILTLSSDSGLRKRMGDKALTIFDEKYTAEISIENYKKFYKKLLRK